METNQQTPQLHQPPNTVDIEKLSVVELKALYFDIKSEEEQLQHSLNLIKQRIAQKQKEQPQLQEAAV